MVDFLIGCDPELFVRDREGKLISAFGMIPGTKADPFVVNGGAVQVDGMALEFNINPAESYKEFNENITSVLSELKKMIPVGYEFDFSPVAEFGQDYIDAQPEMARELGCDPDYNVYTDAVNPKPNLNLGIRTASGHIHVGWTDGQDIDDPDHLEACKMMTKQLDTTVGQLSLIWDRNTTRKKMYGRFGTYRPKPYGVEYRTLSNAWVNNEDIRSIVYFASIKAALNLLDGTRLYEGYSYSSAEAMHIRRDWATAYAYAIQSMPRSFLSKSQKDKLEKVYNSLADTNPFNVKPSGQLSKRSGWIDSWGNAIPIVAAGAGVGVGAAPPPAPMGIIDDLEEFDEFDIDEHDEDEGPVAVEV